MFGMGTGGSLRLLSPERSGAPAFRCRLEHCMFHRSCCRLPGHASSAFELPPGFLSGFRSQLQALTLCVSHPQNRTGWKIPPPDQDALIFLHILSQTFRGSVLSLCFDSSASPFGFASSLHSYLSTLHSLQDQALDRLVSPSSIRYRTSTDDLSTLSSSRGLTRF